MVHTRDASAASQYSQNIHVGQGRRPKVIENGGLAPAVGFELKFNTDPKLDYGISLVQFCKLLQVLHAPSELLPYLRGWRHEYSYTNESAAL